MKINRRHFLQAGATTTVALALPFRAFPFSQSVKIHKFVATLPGLTAAGANNQGNFIPVLQAAPSSTPAMTVYQIEARQFTQKLHPDIPNPTKFWGYVDLNRTPQELQYLGGVIVAHKGTPVRLEVTNNLPAEHILPVDLSLVDALVPTGGRTDIIAVHLHGGLVFWTFDGGPFAWYSSANSDIGGFVTGPSFESSVQQVSEGTAKYDYSNDQSARFIWYHDHAYSLTRTNVFAGLASAFLITDDSEIGTPTSLVDSGKVPGLKPPVTLVGPHGSMDYPVGIPLIIQDKTFWDPTSNDPDYPMAVPAGATIVPGDLWYPHVYEGGEDPVGLPPMQNSVFPPVGPGVHPRNPARWGVPPAALTVGTLPTVSTVAEYFSDTILVNGAPYPTITVPPRRLRFRFLNAAQARFFNLQLYVADTKSPEGITLAPIGELDSNGNMTVAPVNRPGPAFIQIANEAGFLRLPALFSHNPTTNLNSNRIMGYKLTSQLPAGLRADAGRTERIGGDRVRLGPSTLDPTIGNANRYNLLLAPAERADVIIEFSDFAGKRLILYNDAPAPFPGGDIRNDYYVGAPDLSSILGSPGTTAGEGPDTRVLMQFDVATTGQVEELNFAETVAALQAELPTVFAARGDPPLPLTPVTRRLGKSLLEDNDEFGGRLRQLLGNGVGVSSSLIETPIDFANVGEIQEWDIFNLTADTHPMHFHLVNVNVLRRAQWDFDASGLPFIDMATGNFAIIPGTERPPDPNEMGWKETVRMNPGEVTTVAMKFDLPGPIDTVPPSRRFNGTAFQGAAEYVWHCHILEHEEHDMMHPLLVLPTGVSPASKRK